MDTLDLGDVHYNRKILDLQRRYDEQYDIISDIEAQLDDLQEQIRSIRQDKISGDNIYRLLLAFDEVYHSATEAEQKEFMKAFIERIELFPEKRKDGSWVRKIVFNFPVPIEGEEVKELPLESETTLETVCQLVLRKSPVHINIDIDVEELVQDQRGAATYPQIKAYVLEHHGLKISSLYIAQTKEKYGIKERENYYHGEEGHRVPNCPPEKESAIVDALKHFGMIPPKEERT